MADNHGVGSKKTVVRISYFVSRKKNETGRERRNFGISDLKEEEGVET